MDNANTNMVAVCKHFGRAGNKVGSLRSKQLLARSRHSRKVEVVEQDQLHFITALIFMALALNLLAENVALNKPASAGSSYNGFVPALAADGNVNTYWNGGGHGSPGSSMWLKVDLQEPYNLQRVVLRSPGGSHVYDLSGSLDNTNWTQLASGLPSDTLDPINIDAGGALFAFCAAM